MDKTIKKYFKIFPNCIPVKGYTQSVILDLQANTHLFIPNVLLEVLIRLEKNEFIKVQEKYRNEYGFEITDFINSLLSKNIGFYTDTPASFKKLNKTWHTPYLITNIVINYSDILTLGPTKTEKVLETDCISVIIEKYSFEKSTPLTKFLTAFNYDTVQFYIDKIIDEAEVRELEKEFPALTHIYMLNCSDNSIRQVGGVLIVRSITQTIPFIQEQTKCKNSFLTNIPLFLESQEHNTYFNRKLFIEKNGAIKNAPESEESFGNWIDYSGSGQLLEIIAKPEYQKYWKVHKGLCDVCSHCEYRYNCVDNRKPIQRNENEWYFETECNYNPFIGKWSNEPGYRTLNECGISCDIDRMTIEKEKLRNIINELS